MPQPNATLEDLEAILQQRTGCPICHYGRQSGHKYLDGVMYESVNDYGLRMKLAQNMGFCAYHSQEMLTFPGAKLGAAIIEQAMLKEALRRIERQTPRGRLQLSFRKKSSSHASTGECPVCAQQRVSEERAIQELLKHWDARWLTGLQGAGGLCFAHLMQALPQAPEAVARALLTLHNTLWQDVIARLEEFIRKQDYRFRDETIAAEESEASRRAIAILTGEPAALTDLDKP